MHTGKSDARLAIFDLDNTLIGGDSDYLWGEFLIEVGAVDGAHYHAENERYYQLYKDGGLNIIEYLRFALAPLAKHPLPQLLRWRDQFLAEKIPPIFLAKAFTLLENHRKRGDTLLIITATNRFITEPIAQRLGVPHLLASEGEFVDGRFTGEVKGTPCFQRGKVQRLQQWLVDTGATLEGAWFYSDSHNDLPLLEMVPNPVAVDPDQTLRETAQRRGWSIISLR